MKGTIVEIEADSTQLVTPMRKPPSLEVLRQAIGGGWIERVPFFDTYEHMREIVQCQAFCDEEGKLKGQPFNGLATALWILALNRNKRWDIGSDSLVGRVAIVFGDRAFMRGMEE